MSNSILKKIIQVLLISAVFVPLLFSSKFFFPFITIKVLYFRLMVEIAFVLFVIYFFRAEKIYYHKSKIWWLFLVLLIVSFISAILGVDFGNSFWSNYERADGILFLIHLFVYFVLVVWAFKDKINWQWIFRMSLIASFIVLLYGYMQHFQIFGAVTGLSGSRIASTLGNASYLGSYLIINLFLALYLIVSDKNIYWRIFYVALVLLSFPMIFMTQTRGAILGILGGILLLGFLTILRGGNKKMKILSVAVVILIIVFLSSIFIFKENSFIKNNGFLGRISSITLNDFDKDYTTASRLAAWNSATKAWTDGPKEFLLGWGPENYNSAFSKYFPPEIYVDSGSKLWFDKAHSVLFEYLATTGVLGVISYFSMLVFSAWYLFKNKNISVLESNIFISLLAAYTFANMFVFDTISTYILFALLLAFINNIVWGGKEKEKECELTQFKIIGFGILILFFIFVSFKVNYVALVQNHKLYVAEKESYTEGGNLQQSYNGYLSALNNNTNFSRFEIRRYFALFVLANADKFPDYEATKMFDKAIEEMEKSVQEEPADIRHLYNLCQLYLNSYNFDVTRLDKVIALEDAMVNLGETRAHTYYQLGEAYFRKADYDTALIHFQKAVSLNPKVIDPYTNVYVIAVLIGREELEIETETTIKRLAPDFFEREDVMIKFIPLYKRVGRIDRVISDFEKLIATYPEKVEYPSNLAMIYAEMGDNVKAEETIRILLGRDTQLDQAVNAFLEKLHAGEFLKE